MPLKAVRAALTGVVLGHLPATSWTTADLDMMGVAVTQMLASQTKA